MSQKHLRVEHRSQSDEWETPQDFFDKMNARFDFDLDVCATAENAKCEKFFTIEDNALMQNWSASGKTAWMNPPYGKQLKYWVRKAWEESTQGMVVVCLIPARTDLGWFHDYCLKYGKVEFVRGRLKFSGSKINAPFPSMIVIFEGSKT